MNPRHNEKLRARRRRPTRPSGVWVRRPGTNWHPSEVVIVDVWDHIALCRVIRCGYATGTHQDNRRAHIGDRLLTHADGQDTCSSHYPGAEITISLFDIERDYEHGGSVRS